MTKATFRHALASLALAAPTAFAAGIGDVVLLSRLGERLQAEISIQLQGQETLDASCFSLRPGDAGDLPAVTRARIRLWRDETSAKLLIDGNTPLMEPLALLRLQAGCGLGWQRDYILAPDSPSPTQSQPVLVSTSPNRTFQTDDTPPPAPARTPRPQAAPLKPGAAIQRPGKPAPRPSPATAVPKTASPPNGPRLQLGAPPDELAVTPARAQVEEMEIRMLRMEDNLHSLKSEVDKLHDAVELGARAAQARHELQLAQQLNLPQTAPEAAPAALPAQATQATTPAQINWMELLLAALGGGLISSAAAALLIRRSLQSQRQRTPR